MTSYLTRFAFLTALAHLTIELCANYLPVIYPTLITTLGLTYAQVGLIAMVVTLGATLTQPIFGYLSDHWNPKLIVIFSIAWIGVLMGGVGFTQNYISLILIVGLGALGSAAFHPAGAVLASATAGPRRGTAIAIFSVGGNLGSALSPLWMAASTSWLGLSGTAILIPVALSVSLVLYQQLGRNHSLLNNPSVRQRDQPQTQVSDRRAIVSLALIILIIMSRSWIQVSLATYLPEWMQNQGYSLAVGGQVLSLFLVGISVGSLTGGPLSDFIGRWQVVALSLTLLSLAHWFFLNSSGFLQLGLVGLIGVMIGASFPVAIVMAQETWPQGVGVASAMVLGLGWAPGGLGAWLTGLIADQSSLAIGLQSLIFPPLLGVVAALAYAMLQRKE